MRWSSASTSPGRRSGLAVKLAVVIGLVGGSLVAAGPAQADSYLRGPDPTLASVSATTGPYATTTKKITGSGFGGALDAGIGTSTYKALIAIAPFEFVNNYSRVTTPSLILGGSRDVVASPASHAKPFYTAVKAPKEYVELAGADHFFTTQPNTIEAVSMISWLKLWVDSDARYAQFVCPKLAITTGVSANLSSC